MTRTLPLTTIEAHADKIGKILSQTLRQQLDRLLDELNDHPNLELKFEHVDLLEKRFFGIYENMEFAIEQAQNMLRPVAALRLSRAFSGDLRQLFSELCIETDPEFSDCLINVLEIRFNHLQDGFAQALEQFLSPSTTNEGVPP